MVDSLANKKSKNTSHNSATKKNVKPNKIDIKQVNIHQYPVFNPFENHSSHYNILIIEGK